MHTKRQSIRGDIKSSLYVLTACLLLPVIISLAVMMYSSGSYRRSISRMEAVTAIMPLISDQISEQLWSVVAGRESFADCNVYATVEQINATLDALIAQNAKGDNIELAVARRTMDTLRAYVQQIDTNLAQGKPIVLCEATLEEVRSVSLLVRDMLNDYIAREISHVSQTGQALNKSVLVAASFEVLFVAAALFFSFAVSRHLSNVIHEPILQLERFAHQIAMGNLQARTPDTRVEELSTLTNQVNIMAAKLESLIAQQRLEQINLQKAELRTLQAQINPHFLYNTLDTILWQAEAGKSSEVVFLTKALSDFFRISLSSGEDWVTVAQEFKHLSGYLAIQKKRYRDILDYAIAIDPAMDECMILKLLLQPLVENALYHGIKYKRGGGSIAVTGSIVNDRLCFEVKDNGCGMSPEQLQRVLSVIHSDPSSKSRIHSDLKIGFGLCNVDQRIRLYYNQPDGLNVESGAEGTTVSFSVPMRGREDLKHD